MKYNITIQWKNQSRKNQSAAVTIEAGPTDDETALALELINRERKQSRQKPVERWQVWETDVRIAN